MEVERVLDAVTDWPFGLMALRQDVYIHESLGDYVAVLELPLY